MYNVLEERWIAAIGNDGKTREYGIRELLMASPYLTDIAEESPLTEYGIYRFLFTFLSDAYRPKTVDDIEDLLDEEEFNEGVINRYIEECKLEGVTFDLFDETHPFMQEVVPVDLRNEKSAAQLNPVIPTETSRAFFNHGTDAVRTMTKKEIAKALPSTTLFPRGGAGYRSCISGEGLVFNIVAGKNLFETLVLGMVPVNIVSGYGEEDYGHPYYRKGGFERGKEWRDVSLLYGLSFPIREVHLFEEGDSIKKIHFSRGMTPSVAHWRDPYVAYVADKEGKLHPMHAAQDTATGSLVGQWRNIATIAHRNTGIRILENAKSMDSVRLVSYSIYVKNAIQDMQRAEFVLPLDMLTDERKNETIQAEVDYSQGVAKNLRNAIRSTVNSMKTTVADSVIRDYIYRYYANCEERFKEQVTGIPDINKWQIETGETAISVFDEFVDHYCSNSKRIEEAVKRRNALFASIVKMKGNERH